MTPPDPSEAGGSGLPSRGTRARIVLTLASLVVLVSIPFDLLPLLRGPAPYPPEWQWAYRPDGPARPLIAAAACALALIGLLAVSFGAAARLHATAFSRGLIAAAVLLGCGFQIGLLAREPGPPLRTLLSRARSRSFTSYHTVAVSPQVREPLSFLRAHAEILPDLAASAKHAGTHPPGPILYYRAALAACEAFPGLTSSLLRAAGLPDRELRPSRAARAAALLGALLLALLGALTAWPLAGLARVLGAADLSSARLAVLWALLPGPALMTPQFDQALALPVVVATVLLLRAGTGHAILPALLAGVVGGVAVFTSYGAAAFLAIGGVAALAAWTDGVFRRRALVGGLAGAAAALVAFGIPAVVGHEPFKALVTALSIHRETYTAPRDYVLWLLFNPLDLALFLGIPVALAGAWLVPCAARRAAAGSPLGTLDRFRLALALGVAGLVVLGVTRGEVGRLWIPLMPLLLVAACSGPEGSGRGDVLSNAVLLAALTLVMGAFWIT